jgi:hypothetical protein
MSYSRATSCSLSSAKPRPRGPQRECSTPAPATQRIADAWPTADAAQAPSSPDERTTQPLMILGSVATVSRNHPGRLGSAAAANGSNPAAGMAAERARASEQFPQMRSEPSCPQNRGQRACRYLVMQGDDDRAVAPARFAVTSLSTNDLEAVLLQSADDPRARYHRQLPGAHAESLTSTGATIGSEGSGTGSSSKYSSRASPKLARASSIVRP